jgi:hypothetical protein
VPVIPQVSESPSKEDVVVECHAGHAYAQRPTAFWWEGERLEVEAIEAEWRSPEAKHFRVKILNGAIFELIYQQASDHWRIEQI